MRDKAGNPLDLVISPFESWAEIEGYARKSVRATAGHRLIAVEILIEVGLDLYHEMLPTLADSVQGLQVGYFGHPTCIELGGEATGIDELQACARYFEGVEWCAAVSRSN